MECIRAVVKHDSSKIGCQERVASPTSEYKCLISCSQLYGNIFLKVPYLNILFYITFRRLQRVI